MTQPEYHENCDCEMCKLMRNNAEKRIKEEIERVHIEHKKEHKTSDGWNFLWDHFR